MSTFLSIEQRPDGSVTLNVDTSLFTGNTQSAKADSTPSQPVKPTSRTTTATTTKRANGTKAAKAAKPEPRNAVGSDGLTKGQRAHRQIRELCSLGRYDEARTIAREWNWDHVVVSIGRKEAADAKRAMESHDEETQPQLPLEAEPTKAPARKRTTTAAKAAAKTTKRATKAAKRPSQPNRTQCFPQGSVSEADLVLWWSKAMAEGHVDIIRGAEKATQSDLAAASSAGDKRQANVYLKRLLNLGNLLKQAA